MKHMEVSCAVRSM